MPVHPDQRVYLRKPWRQTLEELCSWRQERIQEGCDRWPGTVVQDVRERMLGKWLANQRSYRKLMDANPRNRKALKGMCPDRVRLLDMRLPGWMGTEPNECVVQDVGGTDDVGGCSRDEDDRIGTDAYASVGSAFRDTGGCGAENRAQDPIKATGQGTQDGLVPAPIWYLRASFGQSLERARIWRNNHPDRWPNHQDEDGDEEEARVYRWLIEQRRYKRNFDAGKKTKLGGMCEERIELMNTVLGSDWVAGNRGSKAVTRLKGRTKEMDGVGEAMGGKKRTRIDGQKGSGAMRGKESSGLNYMASLASHEMDAMRQAQQQQQQHALQQQAMHAQQSGQYHHGYGDGHRFQHQQGHVHEHGRYSHGYDGGYIDGQQYHSTQQHIQQMAHAQGLYQVNAFSQARAQPPARAGASEEEVETSLPGPDEARREFLTGL